MAIIMQMIWLYYTYKLSQEFAAMRHIFNHVSSRAPFVMFRYFQKCYVYLYIYYYVYSRAYAISEPTAEIIRLFD